jgi:hypothetical protein
LVIELLYVEGCPGRDELRQRLPGLIQQAGVEARIEERLIDSEQAARRFAFQGSPTLRVEGVDVDRSPSRGGASAYGLSCRLYAAAGSLSRTPPDAWVIEALRAAE